MPSLAVVLPFRNETNLSLELSPSLIEPSVVSVVEFLILKDNIFFSPSR